FPESATSLAGEGFPPKSANYAEQLAEFERSRNEQRGQVLGAAALQYLFSTLKAHLNEVARHYFRDSHPRKSGRYSGNGELERLRNEFIERFKIDFASSALYARIEELALARNAGIHPETALGEYLSKVRSPRFYKDGEFFVESKPFL